MTTIKERRQEAISKIVTSLKPNMYTGKTPHWARVINGLNRMTIDEVESLSLLITCKREA